MAPHEKTYEDGLVDGRLKSLEDVAKKHSLRFDSHSKRMRSLERVAWGLLGGLCADQIFAGLG